MRVKLMADTGGYFLVCLILRDEFLSSSWKRIFFFSQILKITVQLENHCT